MSYQVSYKKLNDVFKAMEKDYKIYGPKKVGQFIRYGEIKNAEEIVYDKKSDFSPREVFYPIVQTLLYFSENECKESEILDDREIIIFLRPCDIHGIDRLDTIFMANGDQADNYYARLRDKIKLFMMECQESFETCFCVSMGTQATDNYSAAVRFGEDGLEMQIKDQDFVPYFENNETSDFTPSFVSENKHKVNVPEINKDMLPSIWSLDYWRTFDEKCIGCGGCNTVCMTCSCFDTTDVIYDETSMDGERRRVWSSCMLDSYTTMAGGHMMRAKVGDRMRFKTMHKIYDFKARFGENNMCVGCGRCDMRCPKDIHFSETINGLAKAVEEIKKQEVKSL